MKVLFIGGTGVISSACTELAVSRGIDLYHLNRGQSIKTRNISSVKTILADIRNIDETRKVLENYAFDVVVDFIAFEPKHIENDIELFSGKTKQYIFISSASTYQTPPLSLPVTENTPLDNPFWNYSRNKAACEYALHEAYRTNGFPFTVVRPSHTYDKTLVPVMGGYTTLQRMVKGLPVVAFGDGTSVWTLTHHDDFAVGLVGLLGNEAAINETFHITSDEWLTWNNIYQILADELHIAPNLVHIASDIIAKYDPELGAGLLGDKTHSMIFDNSKIRKYVPYFHPQIKFNQGAKEIVNWFNQNTLNSQPNDHINLLMDIIIKDYSGYVEKICI
jgi:nucleoside-diphosphate-sugar epimerase